jgi:hypothetical protein
MLKERSKGVVEYYGGDWKGVCKTYKHEFEVHITQAMAKKFYKWLVVIFKYIGCNRSMGYPWLTTFHQHYVNK